MSYRSKNRLKQSAAQVIAGVATATVSVSPFPVTRAGSRNMTIGLNVSAVTVVGTITAKLQDSLNGSTWNNSKTVSITADGDYYITLNVELADDQQYLPLLPLGQVVVVTTNAGDRVTVNSVWVVE